MFSEPEPEQEQEQERIVLEQEEEQERIVLVLQRTALKNRIPAHFYLNFTDRYGRFTQKYAKIRINTHDTEQYANST